MTATLLRHLTLPFAVAPDGTMASAPQDSTADLACSLRLLVATRPGERASVPGYGTPDQLFAPDAAGVADAVAAWEPRVTPTTVATARGPIALTYPGVLADGSHLGFYLLDGSLLVADPDNPGFYVTAGSHLVADGDDPGFFDVIDLTGTDQTGAAVIAVATQVTGASEVDQ